MKNLTLFFSCFFSSLLLLKGLILAFKVLFSSFEMLINSMEEFLLFFIAASIFIVPGSLLLTLILTAVIIFSTAYPKTNNKVLIPSYFLAVYISWSEPHFYGSIGSFNMISDSILSVILIFLGIFLGKFVTTRFKDKP